MKTFLKILAGLVLLVLALALGGILYLRQAYPKVSPAPDVKIDGTPQRLARGKYLVENVTSCFGCHSQRDLHRFSFPILPGTEGGGGLVFDKKLDGIPGALVSRNITPHNLGSWTDGEIVRALRVGVNKQGKALFPLMPYFHYRGLSQEDLYSIVAYLRTLRTVPVDPAPSRLDFPVNLIALTIPEDAGPFPSQPAPSQMPEYGRYMVNACACMDCHTPANDKGEPLPGMDFAGGMVFHLPDGSTLRTANITPDKATGIGEWSKEFFIQRFRVGRKMAQTKAPVKDGEFNTYMGWEEYGGMTDQDLGAIYDFLHGQVKPVRNAVDKFTPFSH